MVADCSSVRTLTVMNSGVRGESRMEPTRTVMAVDDVVCRWVADCGLAACLRTLDVQRLGGCNACRFADPLSDRLCTILDISAKDFDLGVSGLNCSRFEPYETNSSQPGV